MGIARFVRTFVAALWPPAYLKCLLIWPLVGAFRRRTRRSLRWRLAASHFATVFYSVIAVVIVGALTLLITALIQAPGDTEPSAEAYMIADALERIEAKQPLTPTETSILLQAFATGEIAANDLNTNVNIEFSVGKVLQNVRTLVVVDPAGRVIAASDAALIGAEIGTLGPEAETAAATALSGSVDWDRNSVIAADKSAIVGSYPLRDPGGEVVGAVVLDKSDQIFGTSGELFRLAAEFLVAVAAILLLLIGIPAFPIGVINGIRRARAIARPVTALADTTQRFAAGDLNARVVIQGHDEIGRLQRDFNRMAENLQAALDREAAQRKRAEAALAANRELVANVSHELRTPVALVRGHLEALSGEPDRMEEYARIALRETDRLERLVDDLFELTRLDAQAPTMTVHAFDVGSAVREAVESLAEPALRETGLTVIAQIGDGGLNCRGDRSRLVQILQNLIRNAIRFTPEGGIILVGAEGMPDEVIVTVRDTGVGIAPEDLPRVFDRFYRAEQSRNRGGGGAGLGLAIAHDLVEAMGGRIAVESVLGEGTTFTIWLPKEVRIAVNPDLSATTAHSPQTSPPPRGRAGAHRLPSPAVGRGAGGEG